MNKKKKQLQNPETKPDATVAAQINKGLANIVEERIEALGESKSKFGWMNLIENGKTFLTVVSLITIVLTAYLGIKSMVDAEIDKKLSDGAVLRKIAAQSRPSLLFDSNEAITADMGASQYLDQYHNRKKIEVTRRAGDGWPLTIHVEFARPLANTPIISGLYDVVYAMPKRSAGFSWDFDMVEVVAHRPNTESNLWVFRLELVY